MSARSSSWDRDVSGFDDDLVHSTRARVEAISHDILMTPSDVLDNDWQWRGARRAVRFALYRLHEIVERAHTVVASSICPTAGAVLASTVGAARWSLHSILLPLSDVVDVRPGTEWSLRMMLSHVINAQEFWAWQTKHWVERVQAGFGVPFAGYERSQVPDRLVQQQGRDTGRLSDLRHELGVHIDDGLTSIVTLERIGALDEPVKFQGPWSPSDTCHCAGVHISASTSSRSRGRSTSSNSVWPNKRGLPRAFSLPMPSLKASC